jgi:hypothetical protein
MEPTAIVWVMTKTNIGDLSVIGDSISRVSSELEDERERRAVRLCQYSTIEDDLRRRFLQAEKNYILTSRQLHTDCKRRADITQPVPASESLQSSRYYEQVMDRLQSKTKLFPGIVIRQQADLCRSLHRIELLHKELDHVRDWHMATIRILIQQQKELLEEKQLMEMNFLNKICAAERECKLLHEKFDTLRKWKSHVQEKHQTSPEALSTGSTELDDLSDVEDEACVTAQTGREEKKQRTPWRTMLCKKISKSSLFPTMSTEMQPHRRSTSDSSSLGVNCSVAKKANHSVAHLMLPSQPSIRRFQTEDRQRMMELLS